MNRVFPALLAVCLLAASLPPCWAAPSHPYDLWGVKLPPNKSYGDRVLIVGQSGEVAEPPAKVQQSPEFFREQLPPDDRGKFHLVVVYDERNADSRNLMEDLKRVPSLKALCGWAKVTLVDAADKSQYERWRAMSGGQVPALILMPHAGDPLFPFEVVYYQGSYGGDSEALALNVWNKLRQFYTIHKKTGQCPGPGPCPVNPVQPYEPPGPVSPVEPWPVAPPPVWPPVDEPAVSPARDWQPIVWGLGIGVVGLAVILLLRRKGTGVWLLALALWAGAGYAAEKTEAPPPQDAEAKVRVEQAERGVYPWVTPAAPDNLCTWALREEIARQGQRLRDELAGTAQAGLGRWQRIEATVQSTCWTLGLGAAVQIVVLCWVALRLGAVLEALRK